MTDQLISPASKAFAARAGRGDLKALETILRQMVNSHLDLDPAERIVTLTVDTTLTEALHDDKIILLGEVGGDASLTVTLPAATGSGKIFKCRVSVVNTSNYVIQVTGDDTIDGTIMVLADGGDTVVGFEADGTDDTVTLNGTTTGGAAIGDWIELVDIAADQYAISGQVTATGAEATPFSAAV